MDGQAFGLPKKPAIRLGKRLRLLLRKSPDTFFAIVLHELGHLANGDVPRTYFAQSLWVAVVALTLVPLFLYVTIELARRILDAFTAQTAEVWTRLLTVTIPAIILVVIQVVLVLILVAAIRASLLRTREVYADWRAALWGAEEPLTAILRRNASQEPASTRFPGGQLLRLHPLPSGRLAALKDPSKLFKIPPDLPFFAGVLLSYVLVAAVEFLLALSFTLASGLGALSFVLIGIVIRYWASERQDFLLQSLSQSLFY
jgi:hypothetical protein